MKTPAPTRHQENLWQKAIFAFVLAGCLVFWGSFGNKADAASGINKQINFQGKLVDSTGANVADNTYTVVFSLYNVSSGGSATWTESDSVTTSNGIFQVPLGAVTSLPGTVDFNTDTWYLGIKVGTDAEMTPRVRMAAVPYAFNASTVDGITFSGTSGNTYTLPTTNSGTILTSNAPTQGITSTQTTGTILGITDSTTETAATTALAITMSGTGAFDQTGLSFNLSGASGTNLNDIVGTGSTWKISRTGALTVASCSGCGAGGASSLQNSFNTGNSIALGSTNLVLGDGNGSGNILMQPNGGGAAGLILNDTGMGPVISASSSGTTLFTLANTGSVTINNTTSTDIVKSTSGNNTTPTDFQYTANTTSSTLTNLADSNGSLHLNDGNVPNSGSGTIGNGAVVNLAIGSGALTISRTDGKYVVIRGGASTGTAIFDSYANTFTASTATTANVGAGALALPRADGKYELILGNASATRNTIDPLMNTAPASEAGSNFCASATSGTVAYRRLNGKFLVACGGLATTTVFDPVAISWAAGPSATSGTWGAGSLVLPRPDGQALIIQGGATATTQLYDPYNGSASIGSFTAGPTLPTGCEINGAGSVAIQKPDGTFLILSKANVSTTYDPGAGTFGSCAASGPSSALADGAHAIPMQNGKYLIIVGSGSTKAIVYDPSVGTFTDHGTTLNTVGAGAHSFMRSDGTWEILDGGGTLTNVFNTGLPMTGQYISEDITNTSLNITSTVNYAIGAENIVTGQTSLTNNAQSGVQVQVRTASSQGNLATATDKYIQHSGDLIYPSSSDSWIRITVNFARKIPPYIQDDRGTWTGNGSTIMQRDYQSPGLKELTVDNSTLLRNTSFDFTNPQPSNPNAPGPLLTRVQGAVDKLVLPPGVLTETTQVGTTGFYMGKPGAHNPLPVTTGPGTIVLQRPDKLFGIIATSSANFTLYDGATATFSAQAGAGNIPTANTGGGGFAIKLPGEKYLIVMGGGTTTTNIYDPNAASGSHFTAGPTLSGAAGMGAGAILNADNTYTIIHGGAATTTSIFDPVANQGTGTLPAGPTLTTAANCGFFAIPMAAPNPYQYRVFPGVGAGATGVTTSMNYDAKAKVFTAGTAFTSAHGCGAFAFQRADGFWVTVAGAAGTNGSVSTATNIFNPWSNTTLAGPTLTSGAGRGAFAIPRADGTFLIAIGQTGAGVGQTTTNVYFPWGGTFGVGAGIGTTAAGPAMNDAVGAGALAFWRPDGKWVIINGGQVGSATVDTYDAGWYADGQYLSGQNNVSQLSANSTLSWSQTSDNYVGIQVRTASSQAALATASFHSVAYSGGNINITPGDTWIQVQVNMSRDFPFYSGIYAGSDTYTVAESGAYMYPAVAMPTLNWYKISNDSDILTLQSGGSNIFRVSSSGGVYTGGNGGYYTGGADLAENYTSTQDLQPGEVVANDPTTNASVMRSVGQYQQNLLGVVSTAPGFVAGAYTTDSYPIALSGRVPVLVSTENGPIHAGDYLTSSSIPGYAMKATIAGPVIGKAMQDFVPSSASVCPKEALGNLLTTQCGSVMMFVNLTDYQGESIDVAMSDPTQNPTGVSADGNQQLMAIGVPQHEGNTLLFLEHVATQPSGSYVSQIFTGKVAATDSVIAPTIVTDTLYAKTIKADNIEGIQIFTNRISQLSDAVASLSSTLQDPFASQSAVLGVATASASLPTQLTLDSLSVTGLATISADFHVRGNSLIEGMLTVADTLMANNSITNGIADFFGQTIFHGGVLFQVHPTFSGDTAGFVTLPKGATSVNITFAKPYDTTPIVNTSIAITPTGVVDLTNDPRQMILSQGYSYIITNQSVSGFTIQLNKQAVTDVPFAWTAIGVSSETTELTHTSIATSSGSL